MKSRVLLTVVTPLVAAILGLVLGALGYDAWQNTKMRAVASGRLSVSAEFVRVVGDYYDSEHRYPPDITSVPRDSIKFRDGASIEMIDQMIYHCDSDGQAFIGVIGKGDRFVCIRGRLGEEQFEISAPER